MDKLCILEDASPRSSSEKWLSPLFNRKDHDPHDFDFCDIAARYLGHALKDTVKLTGEEIAVEKIECVRPKG